MSFPAVPRQSRRRITKRMKSTATMPLQLEAPEARRRSSCFIPFHSCTAGLPVLSTQARHATESTGHFVPPVLYSPRSSREHIPFAVWRRLRRRGGFVHFGTEHNKVPRTRPNPLYPPSVNPMPPTVSIGRTNVRWHCISRSSRGRFEPQQGRVPLHRLPMQTTIDTVCAETSRASKR
ncbi:hypothetical protein BV20DRAFT_579537 [Pilatotrama ljubarskyi]|nr:hypothetical protein BV20DRAFT_579537 [Pilatotrama ljubarskyi]